MQKTRNEHSMDRPSVVTPWYLACAIIATASLVTANTVATKLVSFFGVVVPGGAIIYPITLIVDDVLTEVYGYSRARTVIWLGFLANLMFVVVAVIVGLLPSAPYWNGQEAYEAILGYTPRLLLGAFLSYLFGHFANAFLMSRMKVLTEGRALWSRTIASTIVGQGIDSLIFVTVAYAGTIEWAQVAQVILAVWLFKSAYEALLTPITYAVIGRLKTVEGSDPYDTDVDYNPFSLS